MTEKQNIEARITFWGMIIRLTHFAWDNDLALIGHWLFRNKKIQEWLVVKGRSKDINSKHRWALAIDFQLIDIKTKENITDGNDPRWLLLGEFWESLGGTWGGRWDMSSEKGKQPDSGHFEFWPFKQKTGGKGNGRSKRETRVENDTGIQLKESTPERYQEGSWYSPGCC